MSEVKLFNDHILKKVQRIKKMLTFTMQKNITMLNKRNKSPLLLLFDDGFIVSPTATSTLICEGVFIL